METTTVLKVRNKAQSQKMTRKILVICGTFSSLLYVAMLIIVPMQWDSYHSVSQTVSELSAIGAPTRTLWVSLGIVYALLVSAFGVGVWQSAARNHPLRIAAGLIVVYGIICLFWPLAPMHLREVLAMGGKTFSDTLHIVFTMVTILLMLFAIGFGAAAFGKRFRFYSIVIMVSLFMFGILTGLEAPGIDKNLPTPLIGVWERINICIFLLWVMVLTSVLLRVEKVSLPRTTAS